MTNEEKVKIKSFIDNIDFIPNKYEIEENIYEEKIELIFTKKIIDNETIYGMQISFYKSIIDIIIINFEGNILENKELSYSLNDTFQVLEMYIKQNLI